ncbi:MAG: ABC transporter permease [Bacteroidales bacterium]|nr:ABC transporter permease [Bacteroidales bacterium]
MSYAKNWLKDFWNTFIHELKDIFSDAGVLIIFFVAGFGYPLIYNLVYKNGVLNDTPVAIVDNSDCGMSHQFIRELDATREVAVAANCINMEEAKKLMQERKVKGIVYIPSDFEEKAARLETAKLSVYTDMGSFIYYKNLLTAANAVMLTNMTKMQVARYCAKGMTLQEAKQLAQPITFESINPYNETSSYSIFLISAILLVIIQQSMFYGMSLLTGTRREQFKGVGMLSKDMSGYGVGRVVLGRGAAYWLVYLGISIYIAFIVPAIFGLPQRGNFWDIFILLLFFLTASVTFCLAWSSLITKRETVFVLLLFISPIALFLTGFSWPTSAFPTVWKIVSYAFPSTFGAQAFINLNTAGGDLETVHFQMFMLTMQSICYYFLACLAMYVETIYMQKKASFLRKRERLARKVGFSIEENRRIIGGDEAATDYKKQVE